MKASFWKNVAKYGLGFGLLGYVVYSNWEPPGGHGLKAAFERPVQYGPLALAALICAVSMMLTFVRWYLLVRAQGLPFSIHSALRLGLVGLYFNTFLPGSVGGDFIKAYAIAREQRRRAVAVATVVVDRVVGLWALVWLVAILGGAFWLAGDPIFDTKPFLNTLVYGAWIVVAGSILTWVLLGFLPAALADRVADRLAHLPKIGRICGSLWRAVWMYHAQSGTVAIALLLALVGHTGFVLVFHFAAQTFHDPNVPLPSMREHFLIVPLGLTFQAFFPAPGGVGGGEYGFGALYEAIGYSKTAGVLGSLAQRVIMWALGVTGYLVYLRMKVAELPPADDEPDGPGDAEPTDSVNGAADGPAGEPAAAGKAADGSATNP